MKFSREELRLHPVPLDSPSEGSVAASADNELVGEGGPVAGAHYIDILHVGLRDLSSNLADQLHDELGVGCLARLPEHVPAAGAALGCKLNGVNILQLAGR